MKVVEHPRASWGDKAVIDQTMEHLNEHWKTGKIQHMVYAIVSPNGNVTFRFSDNARMHDIALMLAFMNADFHNALMQKEVVDEPGNPA